MRKVRAEQNLEMVVVGRKLAAGTIPREVDWREWAVDQRQLPGHWRLVG